MTLPTIWCPLRPCRVVTFSEPPNNGATGYATKDEYLDHIVAFHLIARINAPAPLYRGTP